MKNNIPESHDINVDPLELKKFNQLAHRWWDQNGEFKPLHEINPLRLNYIERSGNLKGRNILDVGCGGGILSEGMALRGAHVTGIDLGEKSLKTAKLHLLETGAHVDYHEITVEELANEQPCYYDIVTCMEMLEHVPDPASIVRSCAKLVKSGGWVFFSTLNRNPKSYLFAIIGAEYLLGLLPRGTHDYAKFIKPSELAHMASDAELCVENITGMTYNPITKIYTLEPDSSVNYIMACRA
ncbi:MAG: bifunctional 2-polyprenyl-6-hydroxyphenol methylase/3-demethylubiquinol 3-O-methyltransferase UbiG [Nitrosospira sp.]|nr:bifunctional 2-polyprenyl-6-hydroxyphenol methylase/3-demethylubiquinol 3-O-methyltransferase UbiG [Nitrosospira sp.]MDW7643035.1 bifunctional 2-polyprenyl-6-hydroxyphenol methylase/3-demethylubiquinol 3-O-methyltransferase UbiG [Nitrosomonadaceae bacterium]MDW7652705.1 bifunctional 2-polyprenyl-6-hydroxyphenol methylase/3-demethylubiquinol 3-O-methyltransferase UbiG [Nitrosomonadaceae bacterium]MDW7664397.1 bifunctional 2-polyprenyl-6-hydroxyphenol methylase/3-demethylubiquinol 3-O-methyltra